MDRRSMLLGGVALAGTRLKVSGAADKPALLGGSPVRSEPFPSWPVQDETEEQALLKVLKSGKWGRGSGGQVSRFEAEYAKLTGAQHCLAVANGTSALVVALHAIGVQAGDEVIVPPYTFIATVNAILAMHALPVFVDSDPETFQIDAKKVEAAITSRTALIMPVHLGGNAADLDALEDIASRRKIPILEDACQSHLAEWRKRKVGTYGKAGCFSFQASKNLNSGEGGAILTEDSDLVERCFAFHNNSRGRNTAGSDFTYAAPGLNLRLTEFQAGLLLAQMTRLASQSSTREKNADYLTSLLKEIPGIAPAKMYDGCTRNAYHLYMFRYDASKFSGLSRSKFLQAMKAEGVPASGGYSPLNKEPFLANTFSSRGYKALYGEKELQRWPERNQCPANDRLCSEAVWLTQTMLIGRRSDIDAIAEAVRKIQRYASDLARA